MERPIDPAQADYDVGYGKPPEATRWQPGQSGNPAGRPPKRSAHLQDMAPAFADAFLNKLNEPFSVQGPDGPDEISFGEMCAFQLRLILVKGKPHEKLKALKLLMQDFNIVQVDAFRESILRGVDDRVAQAELRGRLDAVIEDLDESFRPRTDEELCQIRDEVDAQLRERDAMRRQGMSDEEIFAAEEAADSEGIDELNDMLSHDAALRDRSASRPDHCSDPIDDGRERPPSDRDVDPHPRR